jgi:Flp pilus assembly protein TadG
MMRKIKRCLARLANDRGGNFALMTAFMLVPLIGVIGLGVDLARISNAKAKLQMDLDAAVLGGANTLVKSTDVVAKKQVTDMLTGLAKSSDVYVLGTYNVTVDDPNNLISATAQASLPSSFLRVIGFSNIGVSVTSQAKSGQDKYYELSLILDKSASMLLAATTTDQSVMKNLSLNCVFACHDTAYSET